MAPGDGSLCHEGLGWDRCGPSRPPDQPDDQGNHPSNKGQRQKKDEKYPASASERGNIAGNVCLRLTPNCSPDGGYIARDLRRSLQAEISEHDGHIAGHLRSLLDHYISVNGGYVSGYCAAHKNGAVYASEIAGLLSGFDKDVMVELDAVGAFLS